ncbi:MAG: FDLD family class I lanthipeptide [Haloechinothrix sp.]
MTATMLADPVLDADLADEFDLDVRISVLSGPDSPRAGLTIWYSCMGGSCSCPPGSGSGGSRDDCC